MDFITNTDMDWDDVPWLGMEWEEVEDEQEVEREDVPGDEDNPLSCYPPICDGKKRRRSAEHNNRDRLVLNTKETDYYHLCGWCNAWPKEHSEQSIQQ